MKTVTKFDRFTLFILIIGFLACESTDGGDGENSGDPGEPFPIQTDFQIENFESAEMCKSCHPTHFEEWSGSMHAYSFKDPVWYALHSNEQQHFEENEDQELGQFCIMCHSPVAFLTGEIQDPKLLTIESSESLVPQIREGVTCSFCHAVTHMSPTTEVDVSSGNLEAIQFFLNTDSVLHIKYGPLENPIESGYHESQYHPDYDLSEYCRGCHNMTINGNDAEMTFSEWGGTAFQAMSVECQSCHMETYPGYAVDRFLFPDAPYRENLHSHDFSGIDQALTTFPQEEAQENAIRELLFGSAEVNFFNTPPDSLNDGDSLKLKLIVSNNAGHNFPSGVTFSRQLWLEVLAVMDGDTLYKSGHLNPEGDLYDFYIDSVGVTDPDLTVFRTILYNSEGDSGLLKVSVGTMDWMNGNTILAGGSKTAEYEFFVPAEVQGNLTVSARLRFRAIPPFFARYLDLEEVVDKLTIFDIDSVSTIIAIH